MASPREWKKEEGVVHATPKVTSRDGLYQAPNIVPSPGPNPNPAPNTTQETVALMGGAGKRRMERLLSLKKSLNSTITFGRHLKDLKAGNADKDITEKDSKKAKCVPELVRKGTLDLR